MRQEAAHRTWNEDLHLKAAVLQVAYDSGDSRDVSCLSSKMGQRCRQRDGRSVCCVRSPALRSRRRHILEQAEAVPCGTEHGAKDEA